MKKNVWILLLGILLSMLIIYRSVILPFTHDESGSWLNYHSTFQWGCFFDPNCWATAANHWLNTLLFQWTAALGGNVPWVLRVPNVLAGIAYFFVAYLFVVRYIRNPGMQFLGFVLFSAHIYLLDFFSLARGYGLMVSGVFWSIYILLRYAEDFRRRWLYLLMLSLLLTVLANFTALIPCVAILAGWFVCVLINKRKDLLIEHGQLLALFSIILFLLLRTPLSILSQNDEFQWGGNGLIEMGKDFSKNLVANAAYFGRPTFLVIFYLLGSVLLVGLCLSVYKKKYPAKKPLQVLGILFVVTCLTIFLLGGLWDVKAPIGRKSIFLIPIVFGVLSLCLNLLPDKKIFRVLCIALSVLLLLHFSKSLRSNLTATREWYYDAYYNQLFSVVVPQKSNADSIRLGASWIFIPSITFYRNTQDLPIEGLSYEKPIQVDSTMDYYYVEDADKPTLDASEFIFQQRIGMYYLYKNPQVR